MHDEAVLAHLEGSGCPAQQPLEPAAQGLDVTFLAEYRAGRAGAEDIKRYMQDWAAAPLGSPPSQVDLWDYLGMTFEQYKRWLTKGELPKV